jgi:hypothetical protein
MIETQMTAPLVRVMMLPSLSIPVWSMGLTLAEYILLLLVLQVLQFLHPPIHSIGVGSLVNGMIDISS